MTLLPEFQGDLAVPEERYLAQDVQDRTQQFQFVSVSLGLRLVVVRRPADAQNLTLTADRQPRIVGVYNFASCPYSCLYFFFKNSFSRVIWPSCRSICSF